MFKLTSNYILGALAVFAYASVVSATPSQLDVGDTDNTVSIQLCKEINFEGCVTEKINTFKCHNFSAFNGLDKTVSSARIPSGLACTFFREGFCPKTGPDSVTLKAGDYPDFTKLPKGGGHIDFNNAASSIICVPLRD